MPINPSDNRELINHLRSILGRRTETFLSCPPEKPAIRVNTLKCDPVALQKKLDTWQVEYEPLFFNPSGFAIKKAPFPLSHTLEFFRGFFQMQGIASQIPALVLNPHPGERVLDMAAAPGSKSTQLAALMKNKGQLFLNDINRGRLQALNANIQRAGAINQIITRLPGERLGNLFPAFFDKVLLDAPCTALGTLPGHPEVAGWWNRQKLEKLSALQHRLLISAVKALKVGGELVYSTCSISPLENEAVIHQILANYPLEIMTIDTLPVSSFNPGWVGFGNETYHPEMRRALRTDPLVHGLEGFFVIKLKKSARSFESPPDKRMPFIPTVPPDSPVVKEDLKAFSEQWGIDQTVWSAYRFIRTATRLWLVNNEVVQIPQNEFVSAGLLLAEKRLSGWRPTNQSVQMFSGYLSKRRLELSRDNFMRLFANGTIPSPRLEKGYYALVWRGEALGVVYAEGGTLRIRLPHYFRLTSE